MKKEGSGAMLVTKPDGEMVKRDIRIVFEEQGGGLFEVEILGESPLKGYRFTVRQLDLKRVRDQGSLVP